MGVNAGTTTVFVLTGVNDRSAIEDTSVKPDYEIGSLGNIDEVLSSM